MMYNRHIDKTDEELRRLKEIFEQDDVDRFIDGLNAGKINTEEKVIELTNFIRESDGLTQLELSRLKRIEKEGFIKKFATNYNKRYSTTQMLMSKMRSSISRALKTLELFCEKKRSHSRSKQKRHVIDHSKLGKGTYSLSLWGLEQYKEATVALYNEVINYRNHLDDCIMLCLYMTERVENIRRDPVEAHEIYLENRNEVLTNNHSVIKRLIDMNPGMEPEISEIVEKYKQQKKTMEEICVILYHNLDENEYNEWIICDEVKIARSQDITNTELTLWKDNKQQIIRCRTAYSHIDSLSPDGQKNRIGGKFLARLYHWSKTLPNRGVEYWHTYFCDFYENNGGQLTPVKVGAVKMALSKLAYESNDEEEAREFNKKMDTLVETYMITTPEHSNNETLALDMKKSEKKAANF